MHWKFTSPKLIIRCQSDGGSKFTDRDWIKFIWNKAVTKQFSILGAVVGSVERAIESIPEMNEESPKLV